MLQILEDAEQTGAMSALERDILLAELREAYAELKFEQAENEVVEQEVVSEQKVVAEKEPAVELPIIPIVPIINSTNSGEILLKKLNDSKRLQKEHNISESFVMDVSPYISDMRVLQNIHNEFLLYKRTLRAGQGLELSDKMMLSLIIFKRQAATFK